MPQREIKTIIKQNKVSAKTVPFGTVRRVLTKSHNTENHYTTTLGKLVTSLPSASDNASLLNWKTQCLLVNDRITRTTNHNGESTQLHATKRFATAHHYRANNSIFGHLR